MTDLLAFLHARRATTGAAGEGVMIDTRTEWVYNSNWPRKQVAFLNLSDPRNPITTETFFVGRSPTVSRTCFLGRIARAARRGTSAFKGYVMEWAEKVQAGEILTNQVRYEVLFLQQGKCYTCGIEEWRTKGRLDAHRVTPGGKGGKYTVKNVILVCRRCHRSIEGKTLLEINALRK